MKVKEAIDLLLIEYDEDQDQEIMISWNSAEHLDQDPNSQIWEEAVRLFDKFGGQGFNDESREFLSQAEYNLEEGGE